MSGDFRCFSRHSSSVALQLHFEFGEHSNRFQSSVAVGTPVARRPFRADPYVRHYSIRLLPKVVTHQSVPRVRVSLTTVRDMMTSETVEAFPRLSMALAAPQQRMLPSATYLATEAFQTLQVAGNRVVVGVIVHHAVQPLTQDVQRESGCSFHA